LANLRHTRFSSRGKTTGAPKADDFLGSSVVLGHAEDIDDAPLQVRNRDLLASVFDVPDAEERPFRAPHGTDDNALLGQDLRLN